MTHDPYHGIGGAYVIKDGKRVPDLNDPAMKARVEAAAKAAAETPAPEPTDDDTTGA